LNKKYATTKDNKVFAKYIKKNFTVFPIASFKLLWAKENCKNISSNQRKEKVTSPVAPFVSVTAKTIELIFMYTYLNISNAAIISIGYIKKYAVFFMNLGMIS
jgi:hypothetical protein